MSGVVKHLIKLRNPWGFGESILKFGDSDKFWSEAAQKATGHSPDMKDGMFFMEYSDFNSYFKMFQINYCREDYVDSSVKLEMVDKKQYWFKFKITKPGKYYFSLHQINNRMFPPSANYSYSDVCLTMIRVDSLGFGHNVDYARKNDKQSFFCTDCPKGDYYFKIQPFWTS